MKRTLAVIGLLGFAALVMAARPSPVSQQLDVQVAGQPVRWILPDAGRSGLFTELDGGILNNRACLPLLNGRVTVNPPILVDGGANRVAYTPNVIRLAPLVPINLCVRPAAESPIWDGGCNTLFVDENYGVPYVAGSIINITPESSATHICAVTDAGYLAVGVWGLQ